MEEAFKLWTEDMNSKHILNDDQVLRQKAPSHMKPSARDPETRGTKPFPASKGWLRRFQGRFGVKNRKIAGVRPT